MQCGARLLLPRQRSMDSDLKSLGEFAVDRSRGARDSVLDDATRVRRRDSKRVFQLFGFVHRRTRRVLADDASASDELRWFEEIFDQLIRRIGVAAVGVDRQHRTTK